MGAVSRKFQSIEQVPGDDLLPLLIETATNHALVTVDIDGIVTSWNPGAERITGYSAAEILGQSSARFYRKADQIAGAPCRALQLALAQGRFEEEGVRVRKDGSEFPAEVTVYPMHRKNGDLAGFAKITRDITGSIERKRAEAASAAKSRLLAQLGHEFRTPLTAIIGFSEAMQQQLYGALGDPHYAAYVDDIHASGLHLSHLVDAILDLVRVDTDKVMPVCQPVDLNALIDYVMRLTRQKAEERDIRLMRSSSGDFGEFSADERMVRQCLINLVDNALKYSPAGTRVTIAVERKLSWLRLAVIDQGRGIAKEEIAHVVEPFRQAGESATQRRDGVGLGLALVKSFCEAHGGDLEIESEVGRGTRVIAKFPYPGAAALPER